MQRKNNTTKVEVTKVKVSRFLALLGFASASHHIGIKRLSSLQEPAEESASKKDRKRRLREGQ